MNDAHDPGSVRLGLSALASNPVLRYPVWASDSEAIRETGSTIMLERLEEVPWDTLEHAYGTADDVPDLLRRLLLPDPKARAEAQHELYGNIFHQGTRYPATPYVIPFLIEMCADLSVPDRFWLLSYWGSLITGYFNVQERPIWGDGKQIHFCGELQEDDGDPYSQSLHDIYRESIKGYTLLLKLMDDPDPTVRTGAAWVLACLPTMAPESVPLLEGREEPSGWVRAATAFALGELGAAGPLRRMLAEDDFPAVRCMAACQLARLEPDAALIDPLLDFVANPIEGYENVPGAGGKSSGDAAHSISLLPAEVQARAIPAICDRLDQVRLFDTMPLVRTLISAAFPEREHPVEELTDSQRYVLSRMVDNSELWNIGNLHWAFKAHGLPSDRKECARLLGVRVADDEALAELRSALMFSRMGFLEKGRAGIEKALALDPAVFERVAAPDECWLLCGKAFAETDPDRALAAYRHAITINPAIARQVEITWRLAALLGEMNV
jgi:tetratricopeptide (TPR) repeat protein